MQVELAAIETLLSIFYPNVQSISCKQLPYGERRSQVQRMQLAVETGKAQSHEKAKKRWRVLCQIPHLTCRTI